MEGTNRSKPEEDLVTEEDATLPEDIELADVEEAAAGKLKELRDKLKVCEKEKMEHLENLQRAKADFLNSRKRLEEQLLRDKVHIKMDFVEGLLPLCDSFEAAMSDPAWGACDEKWRGGIEAIHAQLMAILKNHDVEEISGVGAPFNPHEHQAVSNAEVEDTAKADTVIEVLQKGYKVEEHVIRPARVTVGITK